MMTTTVVAADKLQDNQKLQEIENKKEEIQVIVDGKKKKINEIEAELENFDLNIKKNQGRIAEYQEDIEDLNEQIKRNKTEISDLEVKISYSTDLLGKRMQVMYKHSEIGYLELILSSKDISELINNITAIHQIIRYDKELISDLKTDKETLQHKVEENQTNKVRIEMMQNSLKNDIEELEHQKKQKEELEYQVDLQLADLYEQIDILEKESNEIKQRLISVGSRGVSQVNPSQLPNLGSLSWPLEVAGRITSPYGYRQHPILNRQMFHSGVDIAAPTGTSVLAADGGVIVFAGNQGSYGNVVLLDHENGLATVYAHNSYINVSIGDRVVRGQKIAEVGSTGRSTGPHLHFEVRINGETTDPMNYLY